MATVAMAATLAACSGTSNAAGPARTDSGSTTTSTDSSPTTSTDPGNPVTVAPLTPDSPADAASDPDGSSSPEPSSTPTTSSSSAPAAPKATVTGTPKLGTKGISPSSAITIAADGGTLSWLKFTNPEGKQVKGSLSDDDATWTLGEPLGFGKKYTVTGVAVNSDGVQTPIKGSYTTATTIQPVTTTISPDDGKVVGIAAPVIVRFGLNPQDKALIEKNVKIVTTPKVEGAWAWITHDGATYPSLDWRPKKYWPAGTKVHVESNIYGLKFADNWYGGDDVSVDFTIGRSQIVKANAKDNSVKVYRDGKLKWTFNGSFGKGDVTGESQFVTRSGIHVVTMKRESYLMNNPPYYENAQEYWAVRISNNGEFLHNNPGTTPWQLANADITHGCINLSWDDAKKYFESAIYGDPVEVTGTSVQLSASDGDIYDWTIPWSEWVTLSALDTNSTID